MNLTDYVKSKTDGMINARELSRLSGTPMRTLYWRYNTGNNLHRDHVNQDIQIAMFAMIDELIAKADKLAGMLK